MIEIPDLALGGLAAGTLSAFVLGGGLWRSRLHRNRQREEIEGLRSRLDDARQELDGSRREAGRTAETYTAEVLHLAGRRIPAEAIHAAHPHVRVPGALHPEVAGTAFDNGLGEVLTAVLAAMAQERKRVDAAARAGMRGATRDIQAGLYRLQDVLRGLQQRYDDPELAQTLFALDHENEQSLRRAQVTAVVCGAWVGLAREESHLIEAVTGGQSRLVGYHRVQVNNHLEPGTALVSHAVEPVAIIVAELLDNALRHSAPDTDVVVNLERVHHGVSVTVDDSGVGMAADERAWAQRMVAGKDPILLSELGDPPRMGLAAIGQLTRRFDLSVDLSSPSPYGGVRAVLLVRNHLLSRIDPAVRPPAASTPRSTRPAAGAPAQQSDTAHTRAAGPESADERPAGTHVSTAPRESRPAATEDVLPQRRRRVRTAADGTVEITTTPAAAPARSPEEAAAALGALQSGTAAARSAADTEGNDPR
ncbi:MULTISPECIES: ATP-binding protein [unclassified Streptomyces]|uniref:ATP-binding protein n=1 Tax=unclassified Streptomyces TaxID=2593676 RepID=UPI002E2C8FE7|nr:ATP-binding protein [Streptomyces sp. NBC_00223]